MSGASLSRRPARFFVDVFESGDEPRCGGSARLSAGDWHHARRVLRLRQGEAVELVCAGAPGRVWEGRVDDIGHSPLIRLVRVLEEPASWGMRILLVQGMPALPKVDDIIDKGTQVGVDEFVLIAAEASPSGAIDKAESRLERWRRISREAAKQSRQPAVPAVTLAQRPDDLMRRLVQEAWWSLVLDPAADVSLADALQLRGCEWGSQGTVGRLAVWVGPEGGWASDELSLFLGAGIGTARLGRRILRAETAGPVAAAVIRFAVGDW